MFTSLYLYETNKLFLHISRINDQDVHFTYVILAHFKFTILTLPDLKSSIKIFQQKPLYKTIDEK